MQNIFYSDENGLHIDVPIYSLYKGVPTPPRSPEPGLYPRLVSLGTTPYSTEANKKHFKIVFADGNLQLTYSGLPPVEGCSKGSNSRVVFYFECGNHVGQPQLERYDVLP